MVNYSEALLASEGGPAIDHPFRIAISNFLTMNAFVWPARSGNYAGSNTSGLPMGARLQLTTAWYDANINSFDPIDKSVITAMYQYGLIVSDLTSGGGIWLAGTTDQRWTTSELSALAAIPDSAFQVLNTLQPAVSFTGPTSGSAGVPENYTLQFQYTQDSNFSTPLYVFYSPTGENDWTAISEFTLDDASRGPFTATFTPPAVGSYTLEITYSGNDWILPADITFTATASGNSEAVLAPSSESSALAIQMSSLGVMALTTDGDAAGDVTPLSIPGMVKTTSTSSQGARGRKSANIPQEQAHSFSTLAVKPRNNWVRSTRVRLSRSLPNFPAGDASDSTQL